MIVSHKHKFIFVKTRKTAGTSIEVFLYPRCGEDDIITAIKPTIPPHKPQNTSHRFRNHRSAVFIRRKVGRKIWNSYYKFCVERNPWDKTISHYYNVKSMRVRPFLWDDYFRAGIFCKNYPLYTGEEGNIVVDRVVQYENLSEELGEVFAHIGIPFNGSLGVRAKSDYRKDHRPYREVFTDERRKIIEREFAKEIELFGYQF